MYGTNVSTSLFEQSALNDLMKAKFQSRQDWTKERISDWRFEHFFFVMLDVSYSYRKSEDYIIFKDENEKVSGK